MLFLWTFFSSNTSFKSEYKNVFEGPCDKTGVMAVEHSALQLKKSFFKR